MKGICGIVNFNRVPVDPELLRRLAHSRSYHYSVISNFRIHDNAGLSQKGFLMPEHLQGDPPSTCGKDPDILVVMEARIDNRAQVVNDLLANAFLFEGNPTDEQLITAAYHCWGEKLAINLQGAFAIAIWDIRKQSLLLVRDQMGERALYWTRVQQSVIFDSEPFSLVGIQAQSKLSLNKETITAYLLGFHPLTVLDPTSTYFNNIYRLPESCFVSLTSENTSIRRYWHWSSVTAIERSRSDISQEFISKLHQAVERRITTASQPAISLSGGLDSNCLAVEASSILERHNKKLIAFSWASESGDGIDERHLSSATLAMYPNIEERTIEVDQLWPLSYFPDAYLDPNDPETSFYPDILYNTIELARTLKIDRLLNGIGGDMFLGHMAPDPTLLVLGKIRLLLSRWKSTGWRKSNFYRIIRSSLSRTLPDWLTQEGKAIARKIKVTQPIIAWRSMSSLHKMRLFFIEHPSNATNLERFERLSRQHGIQITAPWQDFDIAAFVLSLPTGALDLEPPPKKLIRFAMKDRLPEVILKEPTHLRALGSRLRERGLLVHGRDTVSNLLQSSSLSSIGLVNRDIILKYYNQSVQTGILMPRLWNLITAECWLRSIESG